jgi:predicted TPR repeat methyltransferase
MVMAACDVSKNMCVVARRKGIYATVAHLDAVTFLGEQPPRTADLILAGDVMPYIKDIQPLFEAAALVLKPGARCVYDMCMYGICR